MRESRTACVVGLTTRLSLALCLASWNSLPLLAQTPSKPPAGAMQMTPEVRAIVAQQMQKSDERIIANYDRFRAALIEKVGADPLLSALATSETESEALVHASATAPAEHVIWQEGKWVSTDGRKLQPWESKVAPEVSRFHLSAVPTKLVRERIRAFRSQPARSIDAIMTIRAGWFGMGFDTLILEIAAGGMTSGLYSVQYDLASGKSLDVAGHVKRATVALEEQNRKDAEELKQARSKRDLVKEASDVLAAFRREIGAARLMAVYVRRHEATFVQADGAMIDYDARRRFSRQDKPYDRGWLCTQGFDDGEIDWSSFPGLVQKALLAGKLDEEDRVHARIEVERPRDCGPTEIKIEFTNYRIPRPTVRFDAAGRVRR